MRIIDSRVPGTETNTRKDYTLDALNLRGCRTSMKIGFKLNKFFFTAHAFLQIILFPLLILNWFLFFFVFFLSLWLRFWPSVSPSPSFVFRSWFASRIKSGSRARQPPQQAVLRFGTPHVTTLDDDTFFLISYLLLYSLPFSPDIYKRFQDGLLKNILSICILYISSPRSWNEWNHPSFLLFGLLFTTYSRSHLFVSFRGRGKSWFFFLKNKGLFCVVFPRWRWAEWKRKIDWRKGVVCNLIVFLSNLSPSLILFLLVTLELSIYYIYIAPTFFLSQRKHNRCLNNGMLRPFAYREKIYIVAHLHSHVFLLLFLVLLYHA